MNITNVKVTNAEPVFVEAPAGAKTMTIRVLFSSVNLCQGGVGDATFRLENKDILQIPAEHLMLKKTDRETAYVQVIWSF